MLPDEKTGIVAWARGALAVAETSCLVALIFSPIYISTFLIKHFSHAASRDMPIVVVVAYFMVMPLGWILASEWSSKLGHLVAAMIRKGQRGTKYLGEFLGGVLSVLLLAMLEYFFFSSYFAAVATAALACLLYKLAEPVCYRLFPELKKPLKRSEPTET